jgi:hypothetical protein
MPAEGLVCSSCQRRVLCVPHPRRVLCVPHPRRVLCVPHPRRVLCVPHPRRVLCVPHAREGSCVFLKIACVRAPLPGSRLNAFPDALDSGEGRVHDAVLERAEVLNVAQDVSVARRSTTLMDDVRLRRQGGSWAEGARRLEGGLRRCARRPVAVRGVEGAPAQCRVRAAREDEAVVLASVHAKQAPGLRGQRREQQEKGSEERARAVTARRALFTSTPRLVAGAAVASRARNVVAVVARGDHAL